MRQLSKENGFTLVEVLVAFVLLTIMVFAIVNIYNVSYSGIFRAGRKSEALFTAQKEMDNVIPEGADSEADLTTHLIVFGEKEITISGEEREVTYSYEGFSGSLYYFLPSGN